MSESPRTARTKAARSRVADYDRQAAEGIIACASALESGDGLVGRVGRSAGGGKCAELPEAAEAGRRGAGRAAG